MPEIAYFQLGCRLAVKSASPEGNTAATVRKRDIRHTLKHLTDRRTNRLNPHQCGRRLEKKAIGPLGGALAGAGIGSLGGYLLGPKKSKGLSTVGGGLLGAAAGAGLGGLGTKPAEPPAQPGFGQQLLNVGKGLVTGMGRTIKDQFTRPINTEHPVSDLHWRGATLMDFPRLLMRLPGPAAAATNGLSSVANRALGYVPGPLKAMQRMLSVPGRMDSALVNWGWGQAAPKALTASGELSTLGRLGFSPNSMSGKFSLGRFNPFSINGQLAAQTVLQSGEGLVNALVAGKGNPIAGYKATTDKLLNNRAPENSRGLLQDVVRGAFDPKTRWSMDAPTNYIALGRHAAGMNSADPDFKKDVFNAVSPIKLKTERAYGVASPEQLRADADKATTGLRQQGVQNFQAIREENGAMKNLRHGPSGRAFSLTEGPDSSWSRADPQGVQRVLEQLKQEMPERYAQIMAYRQANPGEFQ